MTARRRWVTVNEYAEATGRSPWVVRWQLRTGRLRGRDLNAGTGKKRPRWQVLASEEGKRDRAPNQGPSR